MADPSDAALAALRRAVQADPELQARLFGLADGQAFVAAVRQLAQDLGYALDDEAVWRAMRAGRQAWMERGRA